MTLRYAALGAVLLVLASLAGGYIGVSMGYSVARSDLEHKHYGTTAGSHNAT